MRSLLATAGLGSIAVVLAAGPAAAETLISTAVTTPVTTGATNDDVRISSTGSVKPTSGAAVTINSNDSVKNEGTIQITGANDSTGILANTNLTGDIDGPFAQGSNRFGIHVLGGGAYTGNIINSGTITVEGNQSAGIAIDSALTGSITTTNNISVLGNDSVGIRAGNVSGNIALTNGTISVQGQNAVGVQLGGNVGGAVVIQNTVQTTGYRYTTVPSDTSKLDADDLLQGGSAVIIAGNVAGGIVFDAKPADNSTTDTDEDDDGIADADEGTASIASYGAAPAVVIGSATQDVTVGAVASATDGSGLVIKGAIKGSGLYSGVDGNGLVIGGLGHTVTVAGGMNVSGSVGATATKGNATAVRIGAGASVPTIVKTWLLEHESAE